MGEDFESKYTKTNFITERMINGFYSNLEDLIRIARPERALEIGCGAGFSTERIQHMFEGYLEAIEVEDDLVVKARERNPSITINPGNVYQMDFESNSYDLCFIMEVLEHLDDPAGAMKEIARVGARYVIASVPREPLWCSLNLVRGRYWSSWGNTPGHIQHWSSKRFCQFMGSYGEVLEVRQPVPWTMILLELKR